MRKIRLFIEEKNLIIGKEIKIFDNNFDYLTKVMRQKLNSEISVFNGIDGEFTSKILEVTKKFLILKILEKNTNFQQANNITLAFSLLKNVKNEFIATKATELGVSSIQPIITQHTIVDKINLERLKSSVKEAVEQCERNDFPNIFEAEKLDKFLAKDSKNKIFILCDESKKDKKASEILPKIDVKNKEIVILVGPEGGFSKEEFEKMYKLENLYSISLGLRILRADTAIIAGLTLIQELCDFPH